ncbi:MAG: hypothetical protein GXP10_06805 [Gammaproteobacteria bacterium]|nr:hypothetical protein [Gammaproteobacteria bacterium]
MVRSIIVLVALGLFAVNATAETHNKARGEVGEVKVIASPDTPARETTVPQLRAIFAMRLHKWAGNLPVTVYVLSDYHPTHAAFSKTILNLFPYQMRRTWNRLVFSGTGQAPEEVLSEEEMVRKVASTPGAIGYIRRVKADDSVHVLKIHR